MLYYFLIEFFSTKSVPFGTNHFKHMILEIQYQ